MKSISRWQLNGGYRADSGPSRADLRRGALYVASVPDHPIAGGFVIDERQEPEYAAVPWRIVDARVGVVHRLMVHPLCQLFLREENALNQVLMDVDADYVWAPPRNLRRKTRREFRMPSFIFGAFLRC